MKMLLVSIDLVLGTRILVNVLKDKNIEAHNLQISGIRYSDTLSEDALRNIQDFSKNYDIVGISFNSFYSLIAAQLGVYLKSQGLKWLIVGGPHVTALPEEVMTYADIAVIYEAELSLSQLIKNLESRSPLNEVDGIIFKDASGQIVRNRPPKIVYNLDSIPIPSSSPNDITYYNIANNKFEKPTIDNMFPHAGRNYFILASRGCPFKCAFCSNSLFAKLNKDIVKIRKRSVANIIQEMKMAKDAGFKGFCIADDNLLAFTLEEIEEFSKQFRTIINLPFGVTGVNPNNMRSEHSAKKIDLLLNCGLSDVRIGVQSGSNKTLKIFNRRYTAEELSGLLICFENRKTIWEKPNDKLRVVVDFICDSRWEEMDDKLATINLANNLLSTYGIFCHTLIFLPGTEIYDLAIKEGWIEDKAKDIYLRGIAGVEDNIHNRLLFLIAVLKERGGRLPNDIIAHILKIDDRDHLLAEKFVDLIIMVVNDVEKHHSFSTNYLTLHPYLKGFNKWTKKVGQEGKKVLFRSYYEAYG